MSFTTLGQRYGILLLLLGLAGGCAANPTSDAAPTPTVTTAASPPPAASAVPTPANSPAATSTLQAARDLAAGAEAIAQSAQTPQDWKLVVSQWQRAINKLLVLPESHPDKAQAAELIAEFRRRSGEAEAKISLLPPRAETAPPPPSQLSDAPSQAAAPPTAAPSVEVTAQINPPSAPAAPAGDAKVALAQHLQQSGARFYSAWWCGACNYQKRLFGAAAQTDLPEVECDPRGDNPQTTLCQQKGVRSFPTWEINGQLVQPGAFPLERLADLSGYSGPRNF